MPKEMPSFDGILRKHMVHVPEVIRQVSGILIFGKRIKSIVFTTDIATIRNINADAVMAVYPFTPQPLITQAVMLAADIPVFAGVGGGTTTGKRVTNIARDAEFQGAIGVVVNAPTPNEVIRDVRENIDIPIVITVASKDDIDIRSRFEAGANILNVSAAAKTPQLVYELRREFPNAAIIATGGPTDETILETVQAGANAITWTPPTPAELFKDLMSRYRQGLPRD